MINNKTLKKGLVVVMIAMFFEMSVITIAANIDTEKYASVEDNLSDFIKPLNTDSAITVTLFGEKGEFNWFISSVMVYLEYDPKQVVEVYYRIREGEDYILYTEQFLLSEDELYHIKLYWIDHDGKLHYDEPLIAIKIDQTPPTITLEKSWKPLDKTEITFEAVVSDATSGVERVEFYLDDVLQETLTSPPYNWVYNKVEGESPIIVATVYDFAGHSQSDDEDTTSHGLPYNIVFLSSFLQRMQSMVMWNQNVLKLIFYLFSSMMIHEK